MMTVKTYNYFLCPEFFAQNNANTGCFGPTCAAWRWAEQEAEAKEDWTWRSPDYPEVLGKSRHPGEGIYLLLPRRGYCGKAGPATYAGDARLPREHTASLVSERAREKESG